MKTDRKPEQFYEKLAHDIKNPLSVMRMNIDLFQMSKEYQDSAKAKQIVEVINREIDRILKILSSGERDK